MKMEPAPTVPVYGIVVEKDVDVAMRDGARLKADVFRPDDAGKFPAIFNLGPYQKDKLWVPPDSLEEKPNPTMNWETVNPRVVGADGLRRRARRRPRQRQVARAVRAVVARRGDRFLRRDRMGGGAALVQRQGRAVRHFLLRDQPVVRRQSAAAVAEGDHPVGGLRRPLPRRAVPRRAAQRVHDQLVHRASDAPHCSAARRSSSRTAGRPTRCTSGCSNNLDSGAFRGAQAQWDKITVPMFTVGNWTGFALHLRGNTEAFMRAASKHKKLRIHTGSHVHPFYTEEGRRDQLRFFDYWLKGIDNGVMDEPPVKLAIRKGRDEIEWRHEHEWPLARTQWTKFYFDLSPPPPECRQTQAGVSRPIRTRRHSRTYPAHEPRLDGLDLGGVLAGDGRRRSSPAWAFRSRRRRCRTTSRSPARSPASFWVSSETEDMDLFLTLRNFDADGNEVLETGQQGTPVPVAKGWLRVSHRELDPELSLPYRPVSQAHAAAVS